MPAATEHILYLTRQQVAIPPSSSSILIGRAEAGHNVANDYSISDAELTPLGREQSANLRKETEGTFQKDAELLVSSPLRRPMQTMIVGYAPLRERLEAAGKPVILMPEAQEINDLPCDTGSDRSLLESTPEFAGLDFSPLSAAEQRTGEPWNSKRGFWAEENCAERARWVRRWLRERAEKKIVVVAHGDILRQLTDGKRSTTPWANAEVRSFRFRFADDDDALLEEIKEEAKEGTEEPTSGEMK